MHFVYIDDSKDWRLACFSALLIPADRWSDCLDWLIGLRRDLKASDGIHIRKEIHATDWVGGKGRIATDFVTKPRRAALFDWLLAGVTMMPDAQLINAAVPLADEDRALAKPNKRKHAKSRQHGRYLCGPRQELRPDVAANATA